MYNKCTKLYKLHTNIIIYKFHNKIIQNNKSQMFFHLKLSWPLYPEMITSNWAFLASCPYSLSQEVSLQ